MGAGAVPEVAAGFACHSKMKISSPEEGEDIISPQEFNERSGDGAGIRVAGPNRLEANESAFVTEAEDAPPTR